MTRAAGSLARGCLGLLALASVVYGLVGLDAGGLVKELSYFTVLSNAIGGAVLVVAAVPALRRRPACDHLRGAAALYLVITGLVYAALLGGSSPDWTDWVQHRIMPVAAPLEWLLAAPAARLVPLATVSRWLAFPVAFLAYTLVHGAFTEWYPYPFLDVTVHGYQQVAANTLAIAIIFVGVSTALVGAANVRLPRTAPEPAASRAAALRHQD